MELTIVYDMRAPEFGAPAPELYAAALDQVAWADDLGFDVVGLGEHHAAQDGYNPSPLVLAAAMGARSQRVRLRTSVLLAPLYDPIKLAEDAAVTIAVLANDADADGAGGWVHYSLLSGTRTVLVEQDMLQLHVNPDPKAAVVARLELGVVARLGECTLEWCELRSGGFTGWAPKVRLWGVGPKELRE